MECTNITKAQLRGFGALTKTADALGGGWESKDKIADVILEHICLKTSANITFSWMVMIN